MLDPLPPLVMPHWPFGRCVGPIFTCRVPFYRAAWLSFPEVASLCSWLFFLVLFVYLSFGMVSWWSACFYFACRYVPASLALYADTFYHGCCWSWGSPLRALLFYNLPMCNKSFYDSKFILKNNHLTLFRSPCACKNRLVPNIGNKLNRRQTWSFYFPINLS